MQTAHVHHQHTANFSTCALCQNWRHWFSTRLCVKLAHFFFLCRYCTSYKNLVLLIIRHPWTRLTGDVNVLDSVSANCGPLMQRSCGVIPLSVTI